MVLLMVLVLRTTYFVDNLKSCNEDADVWNVIHRKRLRSIRLKVLILKGTL